MKLNKIFAFCSMFVMLVSLMGVVPAGAQSGGVRQIPIAGTSSPQTGDSTPSGDNDITQAEFPGQEDEADGSPGPYPGTIVDRSLSNGHGNGVSVNSGKKAKSNPSVNTS